MSLDRVSLKLIELALWEDLGPGDATSRLTVPKDAIGRAQARARQSLVLSGLKAFRATFRLVDPTVKVRLLAQDGDLLSPGDPAAEVSGSARSLLAAERVALNFLMRLSGVATLTSQYVKALGGGPNPPQLLDTRKTTPGLRALEKAAVAHGGGHNHRFGLFDGILIKDNHLAAAGSVAEAVAQAKAGAAHGLKVEVEVDRLDQAQAALEAGADALLLDNMTLDELKEAVALAERLG
ncbi:MAG: carboxylating nicotinate-nucleotide diphosphorylase, partial [Deltaproteobacteria bacterium]|nr:carboxylating nicotinate-nucleotide diphosphorylase [Deltaproteobacteria bacterium]